MHVTPVIVSPQKPYTMDMSMPRFAGRFVHEDVEKQDKFFPAQARETLKLGDAFTQRTGQKIISLGTGIALNPPFPGLIQKLHAAIDEPVLKSSISPAIVGFPFFRDAVQQHMKTQYNVSVDSTQAILPVAGGNQALMTLLGNVLKSPPSAPKAYLYPVPGYVQTYIKAIQNGNNQAVPYVLQDDAGQPVPLAKAVDSALQQAQKAGMTIGGVILNEPSNPMGTCTDKANLMDVAQLTARDECLLISDFAYGDVYHPDAPKPVSVLEIPGIKDRAVEIASISKFHALSALRTGYMIAPPEIIKAMATEQEYLFTSSGLPAFFQKVAAEALLNPLARAYGQRINQKYQDRAKLMQDGLKALGWQLTIAPQSTSYLWVPVPKQFGKDAKAFSDMLLSKAGILVIPGTHFGRNDHIRITLVAEEADLKEALDRLKHYGFDYNTTPSTPVDDTDINIGSYGILGHLQALSQEAQQKLSPYLAKLRKSDLAAVETLQLTPLQPGVLKNHFLKREDQTAIGAYKIRGAMFSMLKAMAEGYQHFRTVSTGNHALGVLKAAELLKPQSVEIVVPENTTNAKYSKIKQQIDLLQQQGIKATITRYGKTFETARNWCVQQDAKNGTKTFFIHPYQHPWIIAGQSTIGQELAAQLRPLILANPAITEVAIITSVAGGGLISGISAGLQHAFKAEPVFQKIHLKLLGLSLDNLESPYGDAVRVQTPAPDNAALMKHWQISHQKIKDPEIQTGLNYVEKTLGFKTEGASAMAVYPAIAMPDYQPNANRLVVSIISGGNT